MYKFAVCVCIKWFWFQVKLMYNWFKDNFLEILEYKEEKKTEYKLERN